MHITTLQFDSDYHAAIIEPDTTSAFIAEQRGVISNLNTQGSWTLIELHIMTYSYHPELVQQWVQVPAGSEDLLKSMTPFQVMVQAKSDGSMKVTHLRTGDGLLGWCELYDEQPA